MNLREPLTGTVALVTGATSGIGEATALELASLGAWVGLLGRRGDRLEAVAEDIARAGGMALALEADVTSADQVQAAVHRLAETYGRLDIVVNNAGLMHTGPVRSAPDGEWARMVETNLTGTLHVTRAALPYLLEAAQREPREVADLVTIGSTVGLRGAAGAAVYGATKAALHRFSEALREEVTRKHVRVGVVHPGAVDTELLNQVRPEIRPRTEAALAGIEKLQARDVAGAVVFMVLQPRRTSLDEVVIRPTNGF